MLGAARKSTQSCRMNGSCLGCVISRCMNVCFVLLVFGYPRNKKKKLGATKKIPKVVEWLDHVLVVLLDIVGS